MIRQALSTRSTEGGVYHTRKASGRKPKLEEFSHILRVRVSGVGGCFDWSCSGHSHVLLLLQFLHLVVQLFVVTSQILTLVCQRVELVLQLSDLTCINRQRLRSVLINWLIIVLLILMKKQTCYYISALLVHQMFVHFVSFISGDKGPIC